MMREKHYRTFPNLSLTRTPRTPGAKSHYPNQSVMLGTQASTYPLNASGSLSNFEKASSLKRMHPSISSSLYQEKMTNEPIQNSRLHPTETCSTTLKNDTKSPKLTLAQSVRATLGSWGLSTQADTREILSKYIKEKYLQYNIPDTREILRDTL
jgi:hypothetical protein